MVFGNLVVWVEDDDTFRCDPLLSIEENELNEFNSIKSFALFYTFESFRYREGVGYCKNVDSNLIGQTIYLVYQLFADNNIVLQIRIIIQPNTLFIFTQGYIKCFKLFSKHHYKSHSNI